MNVYALIIINIFLCVVGQTVIKLGVQKIGVFTSMPIGNFMVKAFLSPMVIGGLFLYMLSTMVWFMVLSKIELSVAYPSLSLGYVFIVLIGYFFFGEPLTLEKIAGIGLICLGIYIIFK